MLLIDPFAPLAPGAWLSFGAVAIILLAVAGRVRREGPIAGFARVQTAVTIGLVPLLLAAFGSVSLISPLANVVAIPLFTLLLVPTVLLGALCRVGVVACWRMGAGTAGAGAAVDVAAPAMAGDSARWRCGTFRSRRLRRSSR